VITHPVLSALAEAGIRMGLERVQDLLAALGDPHLACPVVHIAGTNGKGSVCGYVTEALVAAGYRVGTYTSPHLEHVNERFRLDGRAIDDGMLVEAIESLERARWDWARRVGMDRGPLTYFEFVTVLGFRLFAQHEVDVAVIEVGLGGRLDATNVVQPAVCAITSIGLDHVDRLGETLGAIASEKAGILKPGVPAVVGPVDPEALEAISFRARAVGAPLWISGTHLRREQRRDGWVISTPDGAVGPVRLGMEGAHQGANASVAVGVLHRLRAMGFSIDDAAICEGLRRAKVAARIEALREGLIVDGAHNADGSKALAAWLATQPRPANRILLFGMGEGREPHEVLGPLLPHVDEVVLTQCAHPKARSPAELAAALGDLDAFISDGGPIEECLAEVYEDADQTVVAGSLYLAGAVRSLVGDGLLDGLRPGSGAQEA
jgi:dihydrofolate synthase/folylpolyglutamate synthase